MTETAIAERHEQPSNALTPLEMLDKAVAQGASVETLTKLMDLQERYEAKQARAAFAEAFSSFKAEAIQIIRNKEVTDGPLKGKRYAELHTFVNAVTPALSRHELTASWDITKDEKDWIEVTCIIEHVLGHSKRVSMGGPPDVGGAKNAMHARASTVSYLERYTLKAACGLAEQGDDVDGGSGSNGGPITDDQAEELSQALLDAKVPAEKFFRVFNIAAMTELPASKFGEAKSEIAFAKEARVKKEAPA